MLNRQLVLLGSGGFATDVIDIALLRGFKVKGVFDDALPRRSIAYRGIPVLGKIDDVDYVDKMDTLSVFCAIASTSARESMWSRFSHLHWVNVISPHAYVSPTAVIRRGVFVGAFAFIGASVVLENNALINATCMIGHHTKVGEHSVLSPGTFTGGGTTIGNSVFTGLNVTVSPRIRVCDKVVIGSCSNVLKDISYPGVYFGKTQFQKRTNTVESVTKLS